MKTNKLFLIISREFFIRVKKKSFIFLTVLTPIFFAALMILPTAIMLMSEGEKGQKIVISDPSGITTGFFEETEEFIWSYDNETSLDELKKSFSEKGYIALIDVNAPDSLLNVAVSAYSSKQLNVDTKSVIESSIKKAVQKRKLDKYNIDNLNEIVKDLNSSISIKTYTMDQEGGEKQSIVEIYMAIAYICSLLIYMFIFMFGSMVMRGVIEEKTTRIVEVIVSSVKPFELMLGKILGVGSVALLQFIIWIVLSFGIVLGAQSLMGGESLSSATEMTQSMAGPQGENMATITEAISADSTPFQEIMSALGSVNFVEVILTFLAYFILGYLLYAALFAAVGSAVDNEADTQQLILPVTIPLIIGLFLMMHTFQHPGSSLSFWGSIIPFTSPMVMMARIPFGDVPMWELALSLGLLLGTFLFMTFVSAKIYRVGILMYGKKPNWKEIVKWLKY
ncbi:MAG: ABC transporter permease [Bacteroidales bacterium]|nr:ABC transporter permease [Bacteroidales bacterium]MDD3273112.1 ABC transporter permease [Bacteroidales bacterium]